MEVKTLPWKYILELKWNQTEPRENDVVDSDILTCWHLDADLNFKCGTFSDDRLGRLQRSNIKKMWHFYVV